MASKGRTVREGQKTYWENKLSQRIGELNEKGIQQDSVEKDPVIKKIRAKLRETNARLVAISGREAKIEEMARLREEKKAAPPKEKKKAGKEAPVEAKTKKKEKGEKKEKPEKKQAKKPAEAQQAPVTAEEAKPVETPIEAE
ncbi:MAG: hypothetical protein ACP5G0_09590, partial [Desulfomonilia bacterium]